MVDISPEDGPQRPNPYEQQAINAQRGYGSPGYSEYRPLDVLSSQDLFALKENERDRVKEALTESILTPFLTFSTELNSVVEGASAKKYLYSAQNSLERMMYSIAQTESQVFSANSERNEVILGAVLSEQVREKSVLTIHNWALPYLSMYWDGMGSLRILSERGAQLPMADMDRFYSGAKDKWVSEGIKKLDSKSVEMIPLVTLKKGVKNIGETDDANLVQETAEIAETFTDRLARYTSDSDFWTRIRAEMNTYNPLLGGKEKEKLYISEAMQQFVADFSTFQPRINEDGSKERKTPPKKLTLYFDKDGQQIPQLAYYQNENHQEQQLTSMEEVNAKEKKGETVIWKPGRALTTEDKKVELFVENLDYFNKARSEDERKWIVATTAAMCIENAKTILDSLPHNVNSADENSEAGKKYKELIQKVNARATEIIENFDVFRKSMLEQKIATTAFNLSYAISFGSFSVADMGWSYGWKPKMNQDETFIWTAEGSQGDPTASGDAFTARRPYFHEVTYAAVKNRVSAFNAGPLMAIDGSRVDELANSLLSEAEEINQRGIMIERLKRGEQPHIAKYFGILGAFENELRENSSWREGEILRKKIGKTANPNLIKTIEESIMFVPTPYIDENKNNLYYPMVMPQFQIGLFDMLSVSKDVSVGDMLRKTWKKDDDGVLKEVSPEKDGIRLTQKDINWTQYAAYADDGRAVNDNFLSQVYTPLYGALNGKNVEAMTSNPVAAITGIIKAVDIGARKFIKKFKDADQQTDSHLKYAERPSYEIMYGASVMFQTLALGVHSLIGRGAVNRYKGFVEQITPMQKQQNRTPDNVYTILRSLEDFLPNKQGYDHYSDSFYLTFLAMAKSLEPIVLASDKMAKNTTTRMDNADTTGIGNWKSIYEKNRDL